MDLVRHCSRRSTLLSDARSQLGRAADPHISFRGSDAKRRYQLKYRITEQVKLRHCNRISMRAKGLPLDY